MQYKLDLIERHGVSHDNGQVIVDRRSMLVGTLALGGIALAYRRAQIEPAAQATMARTALAQPPVRQTAVAPGLSRVTLSQIPLGGGGFVTGLDISTDGQRFVCRTDVANAYVRNAGDHAWKPLFSPETMKQRDYDPLPELNDKADGQGVAGIRIAPSNKDVIMASYHGYIWKSVDGGRSVHRTKLQQSAMPSNAGQQRLFNRTIDVHPRDPLTALVGTWGAGAWFTVDGGETWKAIELAPSGKSRDGHPGIHLVLFDPGDAQRVYVFVTGAGLYSSETGVAGRFIERRGGPKFASSLAAGANGRIVLCEHSGANDGQVWSYVPDSGWTSSKPEHEALVVAVDIRAPNRIVASNPNGFFMASSDRGRTFESLGAARWEKTGGEVGWLGSLSTLFPAEMRLDPSTADQLWIAHGAGVAKATFSGGQGKLVDWSAGIEELCSFASISVPGGKTFLSSWDLPFWRLDSLTSYTNNFRYPVAEGKRHDQSFVGFGSYMDYAGDDPNFLVGVVAPTSSSAPGYTEDGGNSWHAFKGAPAHGWGHGGCIAASTTKNIVLLPSNNGVGAFTLDGGRSWEPIKLDGSRPTGGFANAFYVRRKNLSADKSRPGTFALVYTVVRGNEYDEPLGGVWLTRNGGRSWAQTLKGVIDDGDHSPAAARQKGQENRQFWQCQLEYVPGHSGELVYTPHADFHDDRFWWSRDDGRSWVQLHPNVRNVTSFGFGKSFPGQPYPSVYFWGEVQGKEGLYVSRDWFRSVPILITRFPSQMLATVAYVGADPGHLGRAYVGTSCAGWIQVDVAF